MISFSFFKRSELVLVLMGIRRLAIEAKTFDLVVEQSVDLFRCVITESGRGFLFSIILGRESAVWLSSTVNALGEGRWRGLPVLRCREKDKVFLAEVGRNFRGDFLKV